jgi:hypothetical protein
MSKSIKPPVELAAQSLEVQDLQSRITETESKIKTLESEHGKILRGGYDIFQPGLPIDLVKKVSRDFPTDATTKAAAAFEVESIKPLRQELTDLKSKLSAEEVALGQLRVEFKNNHAPQLLAQAMARLAEAAADVTAAKAHHANLEQRLSAARMGMLEADRLKTEHSAAAARAIVDGLDAPVLTLPEVEDIKPLEGALTLSRERVKGLSEVWSSINHEANHLRGLISNRKVAEFMTELKAMAAAQGVRLEGVRDELIRLTGPSLMHQLDADELHRLRHEVAAMRPELDKLRQDNRVLQDGVQQLTARRYG